LAVDRLQLRPGEQVLVQIRPHWSYLSGPLAVATVTIGLGVALDVGFPHATVALHWIDGLVVAVPCLWLAARAARWWTTSLILTSYRLVEQRGMRQAETPLDSVVSVTSVQSLLRRMVGTGRLEFELLGEDRVRRIDDVRKPAVLQRIITRRLRPVPDPGGGAGGYR
jgi:Bacterial PH domain